MITDEELGIKYGDANNFREALKNIEKRDDVTIFLVSNVPTIVNGYKILRKGN